jgi:prepilin-type N-terminal cleavage/methylation domain-containing protein
MIKHTPHRGFTLIELMVSVAIFSVVMVISMGALLAMSNADRKAETVNSVISNLNFAVESMTRNVRTGYNYNCGGPSSLDCASGGTSFYFTDQDGSTVVYDFNTTASGCGQPANAATIGCIRRSTNGGSSYLPITAPEVKITAMKFYLRGSDLGPSDTNQPNVVISIVGYVQLSTSTVVATASQKSEFKIQTSVTQRLYDK